MTASYPLISVAICPVTQAQQTDSSGTAIVTANIRLTISQVECNKITFRNTRISWHTNGPATTEVYYDVLPHTSISDYQFSIIRKEHHPVADHDLVLTGLEDGTLYHFRVVSRIAGQLPAVSDDLTFETKLHWKKQNPIVTLFSWISQNQA